MLKYFTFKTLRRGRRRGQPQFLYVISFADAARRRRRPGRDPDPFTPRPKPTRPLASLRPLDLDAARKPDTATSATASLNAFELENA